MFSTNSTLLFKGWFA